MTSQSKQRQILLIQHPTRCRCPEHTGAPAQGTGIFRTFCRTELQEIPVTSDLVQLDSDKREPDLGLMFCSLDPYQKGYIDKVSIENEIAAWKLIYETCESKLRNYPTTLEEDNFLL